jgi:hypothetical protein
VGDQELRRLHRLDGKQGRLALVIGEVDVSTDGEEVGQQLQVRIRSCRVPAVSDVDDVRGVWGVAEWIKTYMGVYELWSLTFGDIPSSMSSCASAREFNVSRTEWGTCLHSGEISIRGCDPDVLGRRGGLDHGSVCMGIPVYANWMERTKDEDERRREERRAGGRMR